MKPMNHLTINWCNYLIISLGLFFLYLSIYKASHCAFTHDESFTYLSYVKKNIMGIISMEEPVSANNHILNTIGMKVVDKLISPTPFHLRIPNLVSHLLFIFFSALLVSGFKNNFLKLISFVLLNSNIYLIDFFSLARGYGLSLGFLMMHWYFLIETFKTNFERKTFLLMATSLFLAMTANFSLIYYTIALMIFYLILGFKINYKSHKTNNQNAIFQFKVLFGLLIFSILFFYTPISKLVKFDQLYFGGTNNLLDDTIYSLVYYSSISITTIEGKITLVYTIVLAILLLLLLVFLFRIFKRENIKTSSIFISLFLIILCIQTALFYLFNSKFLIQRTAIFLIPLFTLCIINVINESDNYFLHLFSGIISTLLLYFTISFTPMNYSINWKYDADNETLLSDLNRIHINSPTKNKLRLGIDWIFQPSLNYYRLTSNANLWLDTLTKEGFYDKDYSFYFVESSNISKFVNSKKFKVIKTYPTSNNILIKKIKFD